MTRAIEPRSTHRLSLWYAAGLALFVATLVVGTFADQAAAQGRGNDHRKHSRGNHGYRHDWDGGYYRAPPIIYGSPRYGSPYYYPPPVIYGPGPGFTLQIR